MFSEGHYTTSAGHCARPKHLPPDCKHTVVWDSDAAAQTARFLTGETAMDAEEILGNRVAVF